MKKVQWKGSNDRVSALCLGTMYFGSRIDKETSFSILDEFSGRGGNFIDTSNNYVYWLKGYSQDSSENLLNSYFKERRSRKDFFLATKCGARTVERDDGTTGWEGAGKGAILKAVEGSLKRLNTDYVDLLYIHVDDRSTALEETLDALNTVISQGKTRFIGISNVNAWRFSESRTISKYKEIPPFTAVQNFYSYLREKSDKTGTWLSGEFTDMAQAYTDINLLAYSPLLKGAYARGEFQPWDEQEKRFNTTDNKARLTVLSETAKENNVSTNQLVLSYVMNTDPGIIPIFGASSLNQLHDSLGSLEITWTEELAEKLKNAGC